MVPVTLGEFTMVGTQVFTVRTFDADTTGQTTYSMTGGGGFFTINSVTGVITLAKALYTGLSSSYVLTLNARDSAGFTAQTTITFNVNRISAMTLGCVGFTTVGYANPRDILVSESEPVGRVLGSISANTGSKFSTMTYSLDEVSAEMFAITISGKLSLKKSLDYETARSHMILVKATDTLRNTSSTWSLNVMVLNANEHIPTITATSFSVNENAVVGTYVGRVFAQDMDAISELTFTLNHTKFQIDAQTGVVTVKGVLNALVTSSYNLKICVGDSVHVICQTVVVTVLNINDRAPIFSVLEKRVGLKTSATAGSVVTSVTTTDNDGDQLTYTIESGNALISSVFTINSTTGEILLKISSPVPNIYVFLVCASDGKFKSCIPITVTVATVAATAVPLFQTPAYMAKVYTTTAIGTVLLRIYATDSTQAILEYGIVSGDKTRFAVGRYSGDVTVRRTDTLVGGKVMSRDTYTNF